MARLVLLVSLIALAYGARATKEVTKLQIGVKVMIIFAASVEQFWPSPIFQAHRVES